MVYNIIRRNLYRDSLQLLHITDQAKKLAGVEDAVIAMATRTNKDLLRQLGLITADGARADPNDMILAFRLSNQMQLNTTMDSLERLLFGASEFSRNNTNNDSRFFDVDAALHEDNSFNLAIVSIPGQFARETVMKLLEHGIHVQLFSDHVSLTTEIDLKRYAHRKGLFLLGPGAGTSIINGKAIAFANVVRRGNVGIVASAGTGLQEVSVLLDKVGLGVSQGLGVGGSDVSKEVGGVMLIDSLRALEQDKNTSIIVLIAKNPDPHVKRKVVRIIGMGITKPVIMCFLGTPNSNSFTDKSIHDAMTLHAAVSTAARVVRKGANMSPISMTLEEVEKSIQSARSEMNHDQKYVRGLYTGGTLAHETLLVFRETIGGAFSNSPLSPEFNLVNIAKSVGDTILDMGDESFTAGRAHPMIDPTLRRLRILQEAKDKSVGIIALDFMLGYGSHPDPAGALSEDIRSAREFAQREGRYIAVLGHVCGTGADPQSLEGQEAKLRSAGVILYPTNALMAIAAVMGTRREKLEKVKVETSFSRLVGGL